jgi:short-subunit dehydrogenase
MDDLHGRVAIVTGASAGIGRRLAVELATNGMHLVVAARSRDALDALAAELDRPDRRCVSVPTDVTDDAQLQNLVARALIEFGRIDVLINNAGIDAYHDFHTLEPAAIHRTVDVNLTSAMILTRLVLPSMLAAKWGRIVNMSSTSGKQGPAFGAAYGATKAALIAFTQSLRGEYRGTGISATAICPGFTDDGGVYERMKESAGRGAPRLVGSTTIEAVARRTVRALRRDEPEVVINSIPMRPVVVIREMFPRATEALVLRVSRRFLRRAARCETPARPAAGKDGPETS